MTKANALSDVRIKKAEVRDKTYRITDGEGLSLVITARGSKLWQLKTNGSTLSLGAYPNVGLKDARLQRELIRSGQEIDVVVKGSGRLGRAKRATQKEIPDTVITVSQVWSEYNSRLKDSVSEDHRDRNTSRLERHIFSVIGDEPADSITPIAAMQLINSIIDKKNERTGKGTHHTADRCRAMLNRAFGWARVNDKIKTNPWSDVKFGMVGKPATEGRKRVPVQKFPELAYDILHADCEPSVRLALMLVLYTWARSKEIRFAKWEQFDFKEKLWRVPDTDMKMKIEHWVPLSEPALDILQEMRETWCNPESPWVFHQINNPDLPFTENALSDAIKSLDHPNKYRNRQHVHGLRTLASTISNQSGQFSKDAIELQLAHQYPGVRGVYNFADKLPERTALMNWWAEEVLNSAARHEMVLLEASATQDSESWSDSFATA